MGAQKSSLRSTEISNFTFTHVERHNQSEVRLVIDFNRYPPRFVYKDHNGSMDLLLDGFAFWSSYAQQFGSIDPRVGVVNKVLFIIDALPDTDAYLFDRRCIRENLNK